MIPFQPKNLKVTNTYRKKLFVFAEEHFYLKWSKGLKPKFCPPTFGARCSFKEANTERVPSALYVGCFGYCEKLSSKLA